MDTNNRSTVASLIRQADAKFRLSAKRWEMGQNSGHSAVMERCNKQSVRFATEGEALLAPLGIKCTWPGLYPAFQVNGFTEWTTLGAVLAALGKPRNWLRPEDVS